MTDHTKVPIRVTRESGYPRGGAIHAQGSVVHVPEYAVESIERGKFGVRITKAEAEQAAATAPGDVDATDAAKRLAEDKLDLTRFAGQGTGAGGRITKADVEGWLAEG